MFYSFKNILEIYNNSTMKTRLKYGFVIASTAAAAQIFYYLKKDEKRYCRNKNNASVKNVADSDFSKVAYKSPSTKVDLKFFKEVWNLVKILIPSPFSKESLLLLLHSLTLIARTFLSIYVASVDGRIVKSIVLKDMSNFVKELSKWMLIAVPATFINSMIRYFESTLALAFRTRLVDFAYQKYFSNLTYYCVSNLDSRLVNPDQCLTDDIAMFSQSIAHLYSAVTKPIFDIVLICWTLISQSKASGSDPTWPTVIAGSVILITDRVLKFISPHFGALVAEEAKRKGHLRFIHSRIITNSEEIAFYRGQKVEHNYLKKAFNSLRQQMLTIYRKRIGYIMIEQFLMKYVWSGTGMLMIAVPILTAKYANFNKSTPLEDEPDGGISERTRGFSTAKSLLQSAADAVERLMTSYKEINELAGYTSRVSEMLYVFNNVSSGHYVRGQVSAAQLNGTHVRGQYWDISRVEGTVEYQDNVVQLQNVLIATPTGDIILNNLTLQVNSSMHLLITGPNGCGKSSLFRVLGGLWPVYQGRILKPRHDQMYYVPQRPYMCIGTLREQVIYPDSVEEMRAKGLSDENLNSIAESVHLESIVSREGGWDAYADWIDVLSGGEKQKIGLARVFYHKPQFALLDECTSAVSIDVEGHIYEGIKNAGISLMTVTHRPSLWQYHTHVLKMDGEGGWKLEQLNASSFNDDLNKHFSLIEEKQRIEATLANIPRSTRRLQEICEALGQTSTVVKDFACNEALNECV